MKIDKQLNLVIPIYQDDEADKEAIRCYVHSTPIAREIFEKYFMVIAQTFSAIYNQGLGEAAGPRVAMLLLEKVARNTNAWDGDDGVRQGLVEEIRRLTVVAIPADGGWQQVPMRVAAERRFLDAGDVAEVENAIVFFIVASAMHRRGERRKMIESAAGLWGAQISSLTSTEWIASLGTSTATGSSGETAPPAHAEGGPLGANAVVDGKPSQLPH